MEMCRLVGHCQGLMRALHYARLIPKAWVVCREAFLELVSLAGNA